MKHKGSGKQNTAQKVKEEKITKGEAKEEYGSYNTL